MRNVKRRRLSPASFSMEGIWRPHESYPCTLLLLDKEAIEV